jgi:hypothetical protein
MSIISKDAKFFEAHNIIDYSLLIGVIKKVDRSSEASEMRNLESRILKDEDDFPMQNRESKLFLSPQDSAECYIFGIIDILTPYE